MTVLRIAGLQTPGSPGDAPANLAELDDAAARARGAGAGLLITPEMFVTGYDVGAEPLTEHGLIDGVTEVAGRHGIAVIAGLPVRRGGATTNSAVAVRGDGSVAAVYDKTHLFADLDKSRFAPGDEPAAVVDIGGVRIGLLICYDVEFPEAARAAAMAGADLIAVPTANMVPFEFVCTSVIPVRAWENQVYVAYINHVGTERDTVYAGLSSIVGPDGVPLASAASGRELLIADVDTDVVARARADNPYLTDRRPQLYAREPQRPSRHD